MATVSTHTTERRHIPDRRADRAAATHNTHNRMSALDWVAMVLLIIGGLNWGLIGLFGFDLVAAIFGAMSPVSRIIYTLVGLAALYSVYTTAKLGTK